MARFAMPPTLPDVHPLRQLRRDLLHQQPQQVVPFVYYSNQRPHISQELELQMTPTQQTATKLPLEYLLHHHSLNQ